MFLVDLLFHICRSMCRSCIFPDSCEGARGAHARSAPFLSHHISMLEHQHHPTSVCGHSIYALSGWSESNYIVVIAWTIGNALLSILVGKGWGWGEKGGLLKGWWSDFETIPSSMVGGLCVTHAQPRIAKDSDWWFNSTVMIFWICIFRADFVQNLIFIQLR